MAELAGLYVGALAVTGVLTRLLHLLLKRRIEDRTRSMIVCILTALLALLVASHTMGVLNAVLVYVPSVGSWLAFDLYRLSRKKCPYCAETIRKSATLCRFCGKNLAGVEAQKQN